MKKFLAMAAMVLMMTAFAGSIVSAAETTENTVTEENTVSEDSAAAEDPASEGYVTFDELNADDVFIKQSQRGRCTLASATMVMRRAAMLAGDEDWADITESALASAIWSGCGLPWQFTYDGITMVHDYVSSEDDLIALLAEHPEGIVAYDTYTPHAICLTDYDEDTDTFYCSDPSESCPEGRYDAKEGAMISVSDCTAVWYVSTPENLKVKADVAEIVEAESNTDSAVIAAIQTEIVENKMTDAEVATDQAASEATSTEKYQLVKKTLAEVMEESEE